MQKPIRALLLAAGFGTRLRPLTLNTPKCLVKINKKPLLEYWLNKLEDIGVESILINTHYLAEKVNYFLDSHHYKNIKIKRFHEDKLLGTAGTLIKNSEFFYNSVGIMIHSDNFTYMKLTDLLEAHQNRPKSCLITMLTFSSNNPKSCGIVELDNKGVVQAFHEKKINPPGNIANGAIYIFDNDFLDWLKKNHPHAKDFSLEVLPFLMGKIFTYHTTISYIDIGTINALKEARSIKNKHLK